MEPVQVLRPDLVLVDWGPMTLTISAWADGQPRPVMSALAARTALACLASLAEFKQELKSKEPPTRSGADLPSPVRRAMEAAGRVGRGLTPMAAVAGAVADEVADAALGEGADKAIVNNGGDIAVRLSGEDKARVGIRRPREDGEPEPDLLASLLLKASSNIGGVATSGWQGRSLSFGVADLVSVWAESSALADALATALANEVTVQSKAVTRVKASSIDADSDLGSELVVGRVESLGEDEIRTALQNGMHAAERMHEQGLLKGCLIMVQGKSAVFDLAGRLLPG